MTMSARMLFEQAMRLDPTERADLVSMLVTQAQRSVRRTETNLALAAEFAGTAEAVRPRGVELVSWEEIVANLYFSDERVAPR